MIGTSFSPTMSARPSRAKSNTVSAADNPAPVPKPKPAKKAVAKATPRAPTQKELKAAELRRVQKGIL